MTMRYQTTEDFFSAPQCAFLLDEISRREFKPAGMTINGQYTVDKRIRNNSTVRIAEGDALYPAVLQVHAKIHEANLSVFNFDITGGLYADVIRYVGDLHEDFAWHPDDDFFHTRVPYRKLTAIVQLSDPHDYDGGTLEIRDEDKTARVPRRLGMLTVFPSFHIHRVTPVTRGVRHTLATFGIGPRWK